MRARPRCFNLTAWASALSAALAFAASSFAQITVEELPHLGQGGEARAVSADGSVIVGSVYLPNFSSRACRWVNGALEVLSAPDGYILRSAVAVSGSGSACACDGITPTGQQVAFRWESGVATMLPTLPNASMYTPRGISPDGATIVGTSIVPIGGSFYDKPTVWSGTTVSALPAGQGFNDHANAVGNGSSVIVGVIRQPGGVDAPARWTSGALGTLPTLGGNGRADALSADGSTIVGWVSGPTATLPARWVSGVLGVLDAPDSPNTMAKSVSEHGDVIVGDSFYAGAWHAVSWVNGVFSELPHLTTSSGNANAVSASGLVAAGREVLTPVVWRVCPSALAGGQCDAPPHATNLPFEGRVVTDPDHPLDFTLQIVDDTPSQTVTIELDAGDLAALTSVGYIVQVTHGTNPASVHIWQKSSLDLGWAEREWRLRINASDNAQSVANPIELFVHRRSALPPRRLLDGHPSTLASLGQGDPRWGNQWVGASEDSPIATVDLVANWIDEIRSELAAIPIQDAGTALGIDFTKRWFEPKFVGSNQSWIDHPVRIASTLALVAPGAGGPKAEMVVQNVELQYAGGPRATVYPRADITVRAGAVASVSLRPTDRGSGFEAASGTILTAAPGSIGGVTGFTCMATATDFAPNGVRGDKNDILEIVRLVEERRPNLNVRAIGCCLTSALMGANAVMTGELPTAAHDFTPGEAHPDLRALPNMQWIDQPKAGEKLHLSNWSESDPGNLPVPRFSKFGMIWGSVESWVNAHGGSVRYVRFGDTVVNEAVFKSLLDERKAVEFYNGHHYRLATKYDYGGPSGQFRIWVQDPGGAGSARWQTIAEAGGAELKRYTTIERVGGSAAFVPQASDLDVSAPNALRVLVTDPQGRKAGVDPSTGASFGDAGAGLALNPALDVPGYTPLTDDEWADRDAESLRGVSIPGVIPVGTYVIDVDRADGPVTVAWRQPGQPVHIESFQPVAAPWGGRVVMQVTTVGSCPADLNGDQVVNSQDAAILLNAWGGTGAADLDGNGVVGSADVAILLNAWGACGG